MRLKVVCDERWKVGSSVCIRGKVLAWRFRAPSPWTWDIKKQCKLQAEALRRPKNAYTWTNPTGSSTKAFFDSIEAEDCKTTFSEDTRLTCLLSEVVYSRENPGTPSIFTIVAQDWNTTVVLVSECLIHYRVYKVPTHLRVLSFQAGRYFAVAGYHRCSCLSDRMQTCCPPTPSLKSFPPNCPPGLKSIPDPISTRIHHVE